MKGPADMDNDFYRRFLEILDTEMGNPELSVDRVASMMGLERSQFYRKIKALTNYSPVELIRTLRLRRARHLLLGHGQVRERDSIRDRILLALIFFQVLSGGLRADPVGATRQDKVTCPEGGCGP